MDTEFIDNAAESRYELRDGSTILGFLDHRLRDGSIVLVHTEVPPEHGGQGYAATLVRAALDDARSRGLRVVPSCPYVAAYVAKHPEYADLVDAG